MSKISFALLIIIFFFQSVNAQDSKSVISFSWLVHGGNHNYEMNIASELKNINASFGNEKNDFDDYPSPWKREYIVSKNAVRHILRYVIKHCDKTDYQREGTESLYGVSFFLNGKLTVCTIKDKNAGTLYFTGLKQWIERSQFKKECSKITRAIQATYINGKGFPIEDIREQKN